MEKEALLGAGLAGLMIWLFLGSFRSTFVIMLSVPLSVLTFDETKLYDIAYFELRNRLQGISGVIAPAVYGGRIRRILAYVDGERLAARNLSPVDVVNTLKNFNTFIPTGNAKIGDFDYQINANGMVRHVEQMNEFPVRIGKGGAPIKIRDVGNVRVAGLPN